MDEHTNNGFSDWESLPFNFNNPISSSSSSSSSSSTSSHNHSPSQIPNHHNHNHDDHLSIFHPSNHEDLPITVTQPQIPPPNSPPNSNFDPNSSSSSSAPQKPLFIKWFDFALHLWNSKLISFFTLLRNKGLFSLLLPVAFTTSFLGFLVRRRWRRLRQYGEKESIEHLKLIIKEKDEKIIQLLEQIALMNKVLLTRYRVPVWKA